MKDPLSREHLKLVAPSVFAENKASTRSEQYKFFPTISVVEKLATEGWQPVMASQQRVRTIERHGFQKHMLRFRKYDGTQPTLKVGDSLVELVLVNSHDGSSAYQLQAGLFRLVCSNGLVIADSTFESVRFKHAGFDPREVLEASYRVIDNVPLIQKKVEELEEIELSYDEQQVFAASALQLKDHNHSTIDPAQLLYPRRYDDRKPDLWHTFNRVQENLIEKGGITGRTITARTNKPRFTRTRPIKGIDENVKLNKALWTLAEGMKTIKKAA